MSTSGKRRIEEPVEESEAPPVVTEGKNNRRRHRSAYPTPGFKAFGALLHVLALPLASLQVTATGTISGVVLGALAAFGLVMAVYASTIKPLATNIKTRKILTGVVAAYGFLMIVALGINYLVAG